VHNRDVYTKLLNVYPITDLATKSFAVRLHTNPSLPSPRNKKQVLTDRERKEFALFLRKCSNNGHTQSTEEMRKFVKDILGKRDEMNRKKYSTRRIPLTTAELKCLYTSGCPSLEWLNNLFGEYPDIIVSKRSEYDSGFDLVLWFGLLYNK
jgi:hypothetical protein